MAQNSLTRSEDFAVRNWLKAAENSPSVGWHVQAQSVREVFEEDVPKSSPVLARKRLCRAYRGSQGESADSVTNMHLQDLTQLSACFFDMHVILGRISRDLEHFSSRKDEASQLILDNTELPGSDILAALKATNPILRTTITTNTSDISDFMEMLCGIMQTMEGNDCPEAAGAPEFWAPISEGDAWNIALPSDDLFKTDALQKPSTPPSQGYTLKYHGDIKHVDSPRLYVSRPSSARNPRPQSRRVILDNLPGDITTCQVLQSIKCYGGVISAFLADSLIKASARKKTAVIEFVYPEAAADVVSHLHKNKVAFLDRRGDGHQPQTYVVPTPSYFYAELNRRLLSRGCTRALIMPNFPEGAIWHVLCTIGTRHISTVRLSQGHLSMEFTSLFEANRAEREIRHGNAAIGYDAAEQGMCYIPDSSQGRMQDNYDSHGGVIPFTEPDVLRTAWDREPYNTRRAPPPHDTPGGKLALSSKRTPEEILAEYFCIDPSEVWSHLQDRKSFKDTTDRSIGVAARLTRHKWSWSITAEDELKLKLLMANTLHDPDWADKWDEYFRARDMINLRTWEEYGMLAKHRRECAEAQGLPEGMVPTCDGCSWGCVSLKSAPAPRLVQDYFSGPCVGAEED
ncbi:Nucleotide-binding, alpha-beta plait [Metarhizium album ARSEF 1941]|uniref:Nucleotide-binding, alpha-beta plait n=1 Tax=Metarhizium album (strain ARSEF 1941) TaxID=1081103 RepID=A0A0B2X1J0_METAS|nr:Nucleotide-binding, alpha-beta plait [Metarhizium album ARSEF 1941]KHN98945.1 Nucleotide-binding, alpha-beta plait [Metarhizium album ARSEF 1941]